MPGASVLLSCRTRYIAFYRMEYKRGCLGDNTFKREINFKHDYALILKLKIAFEVNTVNIGSLDNF